MVLLPLLPTLSTLFGAFDGGTGGCHPAATSGYTCVNQCKGGPNSLVTRGVSGCNVEQHSGGFRLFMAKLVDQRTTCRAFPKGADDIDIGHTGELMTFL
jgi:hypothetical protein